LRSIIGERWSSFGVTKAQIFVLKTPEREVCLSGQMRHLIGHLKLPKMRRSFIDESWRSIEELPHRQAAEIWALSRIPQENLQAWRYPHNRPGRCRTRNSPSDCEDGQGTWSLARESQTSCSASKGSLDFLRNFSCKIAASISSPRVSCRVIPMMPQVQGHSIRGPAAVQETPDSNIPSDLPARRAG
jgi:hypothetical protein